MMIERYMDTPEENSDFGGAESVVEPTVPTEAPGGAGRPRAGMTPEDLLRTLTGGGGENSPIIDKTKPPEDQIKQLSGIMSRMEDLKIPYSQLLQSTDQSTQRLLREIQTLSHEAQAYFRARYHIFDAWLLTPFVGGDIGAFSKLGETAGAMTYTDTMLSQGDVATAFMEFEIRAKIKIDPNSPDASKDNPAFANPSGLEAIRQNIALQLARRAGEDLSENPSAVDKYVWAVRQAETVWRMWMRAAQDNGVVYKDNVSQERQEFLRSLRPTEIPQYWQELQSSISWSKSFDGGGEFAVKRVLHSSLFVQKAGTGEARVRPYLYFGSQDFISNFINPKFLTEGSNFKDGRSFILEGSDDPNVNRSYVKKDENGNIIERVIVRRNGVVDFDSNFRFDPSKVKWNVKGEDAYVGIFSYFNLTSADSIRKGLLDPEKLLRDPSLQGLLALRGQFDRFPDIAVDLEQGKDPDKERLGGKIYRQDIFMMLGMGLLGFQRYDLKDRYKQRNITAADVDFAVDNLRTKNMITDDQVDEMKKKLMSIKGVGMPKLGQMLIVGVYYTEPGNVFLAMLGEFFKQATSGK